MSCAQEGVLVSSSSSSSSFTTRDAPTRTPTVPAKSFLPRRRLLRGRRCPRLDWIWVVRDEGIAGTVRVLNIAYSFFCREFVFLLSEENCTTKVINTVRVVVDECDYIRTKRLGRVEVYSGTRVRASTRETSPRTFSSLFLCPIPRILVWSPKTYRYLS